MKTSTDNLAVIWALAALGIVVAVLPVFGDSYWFDVVVGRLIATHGLIPDQNVFAFGAATTVELNTSSWLGKLWLYHLHEAGGLVLTSLVRNVCFLVLCTLVATACRRIKRIVVMPLLVLAFGGTIIALQHTPAPLMFAWPLAGALAWAFVTIPKLTTTKHAIAIVLLSVGSTALWANLAESVFILPLLFIVSVWARYDGHRWETWFRSWTGGKKDLHDDRERRIAALLAVGAVATIAAMFVSPYGIDGAVQLRITQTVTLWLFIGITLLSCVFIPKSESDPTFASRRWTNATAAFAAVVVLLQPSSDAHRALPAAVWGDAVRSEDPLRGFASADTPVRAVEVLRTWGSQPRILVASEHASYVLYELQSAEAPEPIVFSIPAVGAATADAADALDADPRVARGLMQQLAVEAVIITESNRRFESTVQGIEHWELLGEWPDGSLYVRSRRAIASDEAALKPAAK